MSKPTISDETFIKALEAAQEQVSSTFLYKKAKLGNRMPPRPDDFVYVIKDYANPYQK